jgi:hypothetical protein
MCCFYQDSSYQNNVKTETFPPKSTIFLQAFDQGLIRSF